MTTNNHTICVPVSFLPDGKTRGPDDGLNGVIYDLKPNGRPRIGSFFKQNVGNFIGYPSNLEIILYSSFLELSGKIDNFISEMAEIIMLPKIQNSDFMAGANTERNSPSELSSPAIAIKMNE